MSHIYLIFFLFSLSFSSNVIADNPLKLGNNDFIVAGVSIGMTSEVVEQKLGKPNNILYYDYNEPIIPNAPNPQYLVWEYNGLRVTIEANKDINGITIISKLFSTHRGLTVGSSKEDLIKLYGKPSGTYKFDWDYNYKDELTVMRVTLSDNKVERIYLGNLSD